MSKNADSNISLMRIEEAKMQSINYWKQFENTGKIEDYLNYKNVAASPGEGAATKESEGEACTNPYAGIRMCDRNHIETGTYRGI